ncbi:hypothetical protein RHSIM_Rhsim04G0226000 [Rhododendron simsii]|uniref:Uncharacterized protein n=1 Tax=Rhododendron simsii TaxID=118357 RepID=A0A834LRH1_RHOSS|nr:hypothetical protein RHSIM_Rhsim04G0226000 [Rhododendron simsii]
MGGDMRYEIGQNAYIKLVLQALNYKTSAVNGLLLGRLSAYNNDVVEITESVPLFHSQIDLLPPLEIALIQDGVITDLQETKDALAIASDLPLSILIVGVGGQILKRWRLHNVRSEEGGVRKVNT